MTTGRVAHGAGVNVQTLRYYERRGLLEEPRRRRSGYRQYPPDTIQIVRFIKRAQELGFTLAEVEALLRLRGDLTSHCSEVRAAALAKIEGIDRKLSALRAMKRALGQLAESCAREGSERRCPLLESLNGDERRRTP